MQMWWVAELEELRGRLYSLQVEEVNYAGRQRESDRDRERDSDRDTERERSMEAERSYFQFCLHYSLSQVFQACKPLLNLAFIRQFFKENDSSEPRKGISSQDCL